MYFDKLVERNVEFDVIGYSYYPKFHYDPSTGAGSIAGVAVNLNNTVTRFGKPVVLVESGFASRGADSNRITNLMCLLKANSNFWKHS